MKITLISPYTSFGWDVTIRRLSALLKKEGHETRLIFLPLLPATHYQEDGSLEKVVELARGSDLIGISLMTNFFSGSAQVSRVLKKALKTPVLWGGIHPTLRPEECLEHADMVCVGEGEGMLTQLVKSLESGRNIDDIAGLGYRAGGRPVINRIAPLEKDLDALPFPDYDCDDEYLRTEDGLRKVDKKLLERHMTCDIYRSKDKFSVYHTVTSRGCAYGCSYCCNSSFNKMYAGQKIMRRMRVERVIEEFLAAKKTLPFINCFLINDDDFFGRPESEIERFAKLHKENIGLPLWITGLHVSNCDGKKFSMLVDAGLKFVRLGIQTGSERTKKLYRRNYASSEIRYAAGVINGFKDRISLPLYDIILDNPWESDKDLSETLLLLSALPKPYALELYSLTFYPGTELYLKAREEGIIRDDLNEVYDKYYYGVKPTYMNRLFFLLSSYSRKGVGIPAGLMRLLTNRALRRLGISYVAYMILNGLLVFEKMAAKLKRSYRKRVGSR